MNFKARKKSNSPHVMEHYKMKTIFEEGAFQTRHLISLLARTSKKQKLENKIMTIAVVIFVLIVCTAFFVAVLMSEGYLSAATGNSTLVALTLMCMTLAAVCILWIVWSLFYLLTKGYEYQGDKIDLLAVADEELLQTIIRNDVPKNVCQLHADRIGLTVKQWRERATIFTIFVALATALQVVGTKTGFHFFDSMGWALVFGGGLGALLLKIQAERFERLQAVLERAAISQPPSAPRVRINQSRRDKLRRIT